MVELFGLGGALAGEETGVAGCVSGVVAHELKVRGEEVPGDVVLLMHVSSYWHLELRAMSVSTVM